MLPRPDQAAVSQVRSPLDSVFESGSENGRTQRLGDFINLRGPPPRSRHTISCTIWSGKNASQSCQRATQLCSERQWLPAGQTCCKTSVSRRPNFRTRARSCSSDHIFEKPTWSRRLGGTVWEPVVISHGLVDLARTTPHRDETSFPP